MGDSLYSKKSCISKFVLIQHILSTQVSDTGPMVLWFLNYDELPENGVLNVAEEIDLDINMDEIEEVVFNAPITDEEILKSVIALKTQKAAGLHNF